MKNDKVTIKKSKKLGQLFATSICGNDITSSCLYVPSIAIAYAGGCGPIDLLLVALLLFGFRKIYAMVVTALPLNGGAYNCLLNTTTKFNASIAACLSLLAYIATSVISSMSAVSYLSRIIVPISGYIIPSTIVVLLFFAVLAIIGIRESAVVATVIFIFHMLTLLIFIGAGIYYLPSHMDTLLANWHFTISKGSLAKDLFFGFSAAMLGISGFESSANFVEEQQPGVFVKTLRNMWGIVTVVNPLVAVVALSILPVDSIVQNKDYLLSEVAHSMGLEWLMYLICIDAAVVLCGAVLTSNIGAPGLMRRMTLDRCLPQVLLKTNKRGSNYIIVIVFFLLCTSIVLITKGELFTIAGVYTIAFLGVMSLFALGSMLLKVRRPKLKMQYKASWMTMILALGITIAAIVGNIIIEPAYVLYFSIYFILAIAIVWFMLDRIRVFKICLLAVKSLTDSINNLTQSVSDYIIGKIDEIESLKIIYFTRGDSKKALIEATQYVQDNEPTKNIMFLHAYKDESEIPLTLNQDIEWINEAYTLGINLEMLKGEFGPDLILQLSQEYGVPTNYMFVGDLGIHSRYDIADLFGVRMIIQSK